MTNNIYLERTERKFEVKLSVQALPEIIKTISRFIPLHEYVPGQMITHNNTIYFDNEDCFLLRQGLENRYDHIRVRARKYEYDNAENAPHYWLELKLRRGETRKKERINLTANDLRGLLHGLPVTPRVCEYNSSHLSEEACRALYEELQDIIEEKALKPSLLASYRRVAFENATDRLSIDWDIRYRPAGRFLFEYASLKDIPHAAAGQEDAIVMELKYTGELPAWVQRLQRQLPILPLASFSKCDRGMKVLLEGPLSTRTDAGALLQMMREHKHDNAATAQAAPRSFREARAAGPDEQRVRQSKGALS